MKSSNMVFEFILLATGLILYSNTLRCAAAPVQYDKIRAALECDAYEEAVEQTLQLEQSHGIDVLERLAKEVQVLRGIRQTPTLTRFNYWLAMGIIKNREESVETMEEMHFDSKKRTGDLWDTFAKCCFAEGQSQKRQKVVQQDLTEDEIYTKNLLQDIQTLPQIATSDVKFTLKVVENIEYRMAQCFAVLPEEKEAVQAMVIPQKDARVYTIGDIHCNFKGLLAQLQQMRALDCFKSRLSLKLKDNCYLVFTGDFVDRGITGTEVLMLVCGLKVLNPGNVFICRGNHESFSMISSNGFLGGTNSGVVGGECELPLRFSFYATRLAGCFCSIFEHVPLAVFLGIQDTHNIVHYGMYNHGSFDEGANTAIKKVLSEAINHPGEIQSMASCISADVEVVYQGSARTVASNEHAELLWGDYIHGAQYSAQTYRRKICSKDYLLTHLTALQEQNFTIDFQARGHQHKDGGVLILDPSYDDQSSTSGWRKMIVSTFPFLIKQKEVFMFMCVGGAVYNYSCLGLGQFTFATGDQWALSSYIMDIPTSERFVQQIKADLF